LTAPSIWVKAIDKGLLSCPLSEGWDRRQYHTHIVPIHTRTRHEQYLFFHLLAAGINAYHFAYPVVPKGKSRLRMVFHAHNTEEEVDRTVKAIHEWAEEMLTIEESGLDKIPSAARKAFAM
jgi:8-amino-7-oxononanoate synthase